MKRFHVTLLSNELQLVLEYDVNAENEKQAVRKSLMKARKLDEVNGSTYTLHDVKECK